MIAIVKKRKIKNLTKKDFTDTLYSGHHNTYIVSNNQIRTEQK